MLVKGNKNLDKLSITEHKYSLFWSKSATKLIFIFKSNLNYLTKKYKLIELLVRIHDYVNSFRGKNGRTKKAFIQRNRRICI